MPVLVDENVIWFDVAEIASNTKCRGVRKAPTDE